MASLDWQTSREGAVTLVELLVTSQTRERVRIENCLDGPVWPPRRQGVPAEGWTTDEDGHAFEGVVAPSERLVLGYASPAAPADPPARIGNATPVAGGEDDDTEVSARDVVRTLGDPRPPRDAVPRNADRSTANRQGVDPGDDRQTVARSQEPTEVEPDPCPDAVTAWLDDVAERVDDAERLAAASSVEEASTAVDDVGDLATVVTLDAQLTADRQHLVDVIERSQALAGRLETVDVPVETLRRLA